MKNTKILLKVRRSRKSYFLIYFLILAIIGFLAYSKVIGLAVSSLALILSVSFIFLLIKFTEVHRMKDWWAITDSVLIQSLSLLNKNIREIAFSSISDIEIDQPLFKRFLNYGDVNVRLFLSEKPIRISNINNPEGFVEDFQLIVSHSRKGGGVLGREEF